MSAADLSLTPAQAIFRGTRRLLAESGHGTLAELTLATGRRVDIMGVDRRGQILVVEVKSSVADFRADRKWREYLEFCDAFAFAVGPDFPQELIPHEAGLLVADAYGAAVIRPPAGTALVAARRKALLLRFGLVAAARLQMLDDPPL
jgi:hypothetical protein